MRAKRKLFRKALLLKMATEAYQGPVPISALMRKYSLDCSHPHVAKLIDLVNRFKGNSEIMASIFPPWLNETDNIQEEPDNYKYEGTFPWGKWIVK